MERLIDLFCHAIRITDPLSIKIAVGIIGGGLPLIFMVAALTKPGEFVARQRETTVPNTPGKTLFRRARSQERKHSPSLSPHPEEATG